VQPSRRLPERVALDVEHDVAHRRPRQPVEAALGLDRERVPGEFSGRPVMKLQTRLIAQRLEGVRRDPIDLRVRRRRQLRQRLYTSRSQPRDMLAPDAGDQHQVILPHPALVAPRTELAQPAMVHGVRLRRRTPTDGGEEPTANTSIIGIEIGRT
jgi:hypothetical protein